MKEIFAIKKQSLAGIAFLLAAYVSVSLTACGRVDDSVLPGTSNVLETDTAILTESEKELSLEDAALADRAAEILWAEYSLPSKEHFEVEVSQHASGGGATVEFELQIGGYSTWETYYVYFQTDGSVERVFDVSAGEYSRYLENATPERIASAETALSEHLAPHGDKYSGYYLSIDDEGYLCLSFEVIVELDPPFWAEEGGCGIDHEHKFFHERICSAKE